MSSGSNSAGGAAQHQPPRKTRRRAAAAVMAPEVVPALAGFLMLDNNDTVVDAELVEGYVRRFSALADSGQAEAEAAQIMGCMATGNVVVVRAVMLAMVDRYPSPPPRDPPAADRQVPQVVVPPIDGFNV